MAEQRQPEDRFVEANGLRLHYLDWGGDGPNVLFVHGGTGNAHDWDGLAGDLSRDYHVYSLDQRGHGDSDWSQEGYWPWHLAEDLHQVVEALDLAPFNLIGQSMGVWTSIAYAGDHWRNLKHLILTDFGPEVERSAAKGIRTLITDRPQAFKTEEEAVEFLQKIYPTRPRTLLERRVKYGMRRNWADKLIWKHDPDSTWITGSAGLRATPYLWDQLGKVRCPTLIIRGEKSNMLTPGIMERMAGAVPGSKTAEIPGTWHFLFDEDPEAFARITRDFLAS